MKLRLFKTVFASVILILYTNISVAIDGAYFFKQLSIENGLTQSSVRCILNDRKGFIWIGTKSGLNRYDRNTLKHYLYKKNEAGSLPGNQINFLTEDKQGDIWIGTENGLAIYDRANDNFKPILVNNKLLIARSGIALPNGMLFGAVGKIYEYKFATKSFETITPTTNGKMEEAFNKIIKWDENRFLLKTRRDGIWVFNYTNRSLKRASFIAERELMALYLDSKQQIWISPYGKGVKGYDKNGKLTHQYTTGNSGLNNDIVLDIVEHNGEMWFATDGGGINILAPNTNKFSILKNIPGKPSSLPENSLLTLYVDNEKNVWAGSIRGGLIAIRKTFMQTYLEVPAGGQYGLSNKTVLNLYEDDAGFIWIGTDGGGINRFNPANGEFKHFLSTYGLKVAAITEVNNNQLLIYAFSKGLYLFNKNTGSISLFNATSNYVQKSSSGIAINLSRMAPNSVYLFADQITRYDSQSNTFSPVSFNPNANVYSSLQKIYANATNTYLFGPYGVFSLNHAENKIHTLFKLASNGNPIMSACRDSRGIFWIGNREGLMYYDAKAKTLRKIATSLFSEVSSLVIDHQDRLWIGAQNMVFVYNYKTNKFVGYGETDGVIPNEFIYKSSMVAKNGDIYLGGVKGLLRVTKDIPTQTIESPNIELMSLGINGIETTVDNNEISIPWDNTSLAIKVIARETDVFRKKMFRFTITGLHDRTIETYEPTLVIGQLNAGNYKVMVSCSLPNGGWSLPENILTINVSPPWFKSSWFILLMIIVISSLVILLYKAALRKRELKLEADLKEHTQKANQAKIQFLIHISHELRTPLTLIYAPLQRMLQDANLKEDLAAKIKGIFKHAVHMRDMINMVLDVQKVELGREKLNLSVNNLNNWIKRTTEAFLPEFTQKEITVKYELDNEITAIAFDQKKCSLVLNNLLSNALKFSIRNGVVTVRSIAFENYVRVEITDTGIGLDGVDMNQLFGSFYQGEHQVYGSGIGLSYAKMLIDLHRGKIGAHPNTPRGAVFFFDLPINLENQNEVFEIAENQNSSISMVQKASPETNTTAIATNFSATKYTLLIIEDEIEIAKFLSDNLKPSFKDILIANDGLTGLELAQNNRPDIILSDIMMPRADGFEVCKNIKEDLNISHTPIVLLTTQGDAQSRNIGYKLGADAYIPKPFDLDHLQLVIFSLLKNREAVKERYKRNDLFALEIDATFSTADEQFITKLNSLITENIENPKLDVEFLTDKMAMSRATLYNKLKNIADIGVNDYINKLRLEKATVLLINTDLPIMEIADKLGFNNQRYFSTVFKQTFELSPSAYRAKFNKMT